ncbi:folate family ECF transporter S component [Lachnoclostridium sp.]|uniref:folate family ECF transporter S component n=1 Tax=Lachnoclostridium sp. TaxID=2028282 RepID=UPI00289FD916|nr:folate family ECF transporter S component [Lachnoclostridium sp.]
MLNQEKNSKNKDFKKGKKLFTLETFIVLALLVAIEVILTRFFSLKQWNLRFSFGFIPVVIAAILYGPIASATVAACSDFLGAILFPMGGAYFPGFTITAFISGIIYGLFLHKKQSLPNIVGAAVVTQFICGLVMNSYWLSIISSKSTFWGLISVRSIQTVVMSIVIISVTYVLSKTIVPIIKKAIVIM